MPFFIDFKTAFDNVQHYKTSQLLKRTGIEDKDLCLHMQPEGNYTYGQRYLIRI